MKTDVASISKNTGYKEKHIEKIKNWIFNDKHEFLDTSDKRFESDYYMSQSWQRLIEGKNILPEDIIMLKHEIAEIYCVNKGFSQDEAHIKVSKRFNYSEAIRRKK